MVADDYSAAAPVPVCDILLKIGAIMCRALGNAELRVLVRTFFPWDACLSLGESSAYACFLVGTR